MTERRDPENTAAFILTHGRPDNVVTYRSLRRHGWTGRIVLLVDDEDPTGDEYERRYPGEVIRFSKPAIAATFDEGDLSPDRRTIVYARNAAYDVARELGLDYIIQLDDDYTTFIYRLREPGPHSRFGVSYGSQGIRSFDAISRLMVGLLEDTGAITVAMSQGGDHIGGIRSATLRRGFKRKAMNSFWLRVDRPVRFLGRLNEDVNAYCLGGSRGDLYLTTALLQLEQTATQQAKGGMTETYLASGTYVKSFFTVMMCPSFVSIKAMGRTDWRLHHQVHWNNAVPKILAPELRRPA